MQNLSLKQQKELLLNPNVQKLTDKHVVFKSKFKIKAIKQYFNGKSPNEIFSDAGIDLSSFSEDYCRNCLKRWLKKHRDGGFDALKSDMRGKGATGRPKSENLNNLSYEELEAIVKMQKEVIDELKKRKALAKKK